jgi:hypothetical protein
MVLLCFCLPTGMCIFLAPSRVASGRLVSGSDGIGLHQFHDNVIAAPWQNRSCIVFFFFFFLTPCLGNWLLPNSLDLHGSCQCHSYHCCHHYS